MYEKVVVSGSTVYAIGRANSFASYTLHVTAISSTTGELLQSVHLPSSLGNSPADYFPLASPGEDSSQLVWLEKGVVKHVALTPKLAAKPTSISGSKYERIIDLGLGDKGFFVARKSDGSAYVYKLENAKLQRTWEFAGSVCSWTVNETQTHASQVTSGDSADSLYTGGVDKDGNPYIGRLYWSHAYQVCPLFNPSVTFSLHA